MKLGDINRDGWQDIVTGWEEGGEVRAAAIVEVPIVDVVGKSIRETRM